MCCRGGRCTCCAGLLAGAADRGQATGRDRSPMGPHHVGADHPGRARWHRRAAHHSPVQQNLEFTGGTAVKYDQSTLFAAPTWQALAKRARRSVVASSAPVVRLADAKQMQLGHVAEQTPAGASTPSPAKADSSDAGSAIHRLADWLETTQVRQLSATPVVARISMRSSISAQCSSRRFDQLCV